MKAFRVCILVGFYLLFLAGLGLWILSSTEPGPIRPIRTRPPTIDR